MSLVVVYLKVPKVHVIILDSWIYGLNESKLRNYGLNSNQDHRFFFSTDAIGADEMPDDTYIPNFDLPLSEEFPPLGDSCYIGRVKRFFGRFQLELDFVK